MADDRKLEKTSVPGIFRRHASGCKRNGRCKCPYVIVWRDRGRQHKQMFASFDLAREHKASLGSGKTTRRPLSSETIAAYYERWLPAYTGRTSRGFEESTRSSYEIAFRLHILLLPIGRMRMREVGSPDIRDWLRELDRRGVGHSTITKAKAALSVMLACAAEDGDLSSNPAAGVRYVPSAEAKRRNPARERRALTAADVVAILDAMPESWRAFFTLLAQTGVRISELLGLNWENVHLGDDPHILVTEQVYRGQRKKLKTNASRARVPLSPTMAAWLAALRPANVAARAPVFPSSVGTPLSYHNVYHRVLQPALIDAGLAIKVGEKTNGEPIYDYQGIAFHAFRKACGSLLLAHGKTLKQVQGWLRHSQLTTTMNVYIHQVDDGLGGAAAWEEILPVRAVESESGSGCVAPSMRPTDSRCLRAQPLPGATAGATPSPEPAAKHANMPQQEDTSQSQISDQRKTAANPRSHS